MTTITENIINGHLEDIDAALDALIGDETLPMADYVEALEIVHSRVTGLMVAGRNDLANQGF